MIYYYAIIIHHEGHGPIPVCEMLTSDQTTPNLIYFFQKWLRNLQSWALLHSICQAFNKTIIVGYLEASWITLNAKEAFLLTTTINFCSAHVIHRFCGNLKEIFLLSKPIFRFAISSFATLQNCTSLSQGIEIFQLICIIFTSPT